MTEQIKDRIEKATKHLGSIPFCRLNVNQGESVEMAIRSLEAWEEVLTELEEARDRFSRCHLQGEAIGVVSAIEVIKQKLSEIEEGEEYENIQRN